MKNPLFGLLWLIVLMGVLYGIWVWSDGKIGYWAIPIVLVVGSIPMLVSRLLKAKRNPN